MPPKDIPPPPDASKPNPPTKPDDLTKALFGEGAPIDDLAKKHTDNIIEAKKPGHIRSQEIDRTIMDENNEQVRRNRELGVRLASSPQVELSELTGLLSEEVFQQLSRDDEKIMTTDRLIDVLDRQLDALNQGSASIFKELKEGEITAEEGERRRQGQARIIDLKATFLGISEEFFNKGQIAEGIKVMNIARPNFFHSEPLWFTEMIAQAAGRADLTNPVVRDELGKFAGFGVNGFYVDEKDQARAKGDEPDEALSPRLRIYRYAVRAQAISNEEAEKAEQLQKQQEYEEKVIKGRNRHIDQTVGGAEDRFNEYVAYGSRDARGFGDLLSILEQSEGWELFRELRGGQEYKGLIGHLEFLNKILTNPELTDKVVDFVSAQPYYSDFGDRLRIQYEHGGELAQWRDHIRDRLTIDIYANAFSFLRKTLEYEGQGLDESTRAKVQQKALEVLGGGRAADWLANKEGLSFEQQLFRKKLLDYYRSLTMNPEKRQALSLEDRENVERLVERFQRNRVDQNQAQRIFERFRKLGSVAVQADLAVQERQAQQAEQRRLKLEKEDQQKTALHQRLEAVSVSLDGLENNLQITYPELKAKAEELSRLSSSVLGDYITITESKPGKDPVVNVAVNTIKETALRQDIDEVKVNLGQTGDPENQKALRERLARSEVQLEFLGRLKPFVEQINSSSNKRTVKGSGFLAKSKGAITRTAFSEFSSTPGVYLSDLIREIEKQPVMKGQVTEQTDVRKSPVTRTLVELRGELDALTGNRDLIGQAGHIESLTNLVNKALSDVNGLLSGVKSKMGEAVVTQVKHFLYRNLQNELGSQQRLTY